MTVRSRLCGGASSDALREARQGDGARFFPLRRWGHVRYSSAEGARMRVTILSGLGALALIGAMVVAGEARAKRGCQSRRGGGAGSAAKRKAACYASAARGGVDAAPACLANSDAKLAKRWSAAEKSGACVTTGDL